MRGVLKRRSLGEDGLWRWEKVDVDISRGILRIADERRLVERATTWRQTSKTTPRGFDVRVVGDEVVSFIAETADFAADWVHAINAAVTSMPPVQETEDEERGCSVANATAPEIDERRLVSSQQGRSVRNEGRSSLDDLDTNERLVYQQGRQRLVRDGKRVLAGHASPGGAVQQKERGAGDHRLRDERPVEYKERFATTQQSASLRKEEPPEDEDDDRRELARSDPAARELPDERRELFVTVAAQHAVIAEDTRALLPTSERLVAESHELRATVSAQHAAVAAGLEAELAEARKELAQLTMQRVADAEAQATARREESECVRTLERRCDADARRAEKHAKRLEDRVVALTARLSAADDRAEAAELQLEGVESKMLTLRRRLDTAQDEAQRQATACEPHESDLHVPAKVVAQDGGVLRVETDEGVMRTVEAANAIGLDEQCLSPKIDDLIMLNELNEKSILHSLRIRFKEDQIYTKVSSILVSVNPFKLLPIYTPEMMDQYRDGSRGKPPHVFGIAIDAYLAMVNDRQNQSIVISGESGAGKSEATKLILQVIADASSQRGDHSVAIEQRILQATPILEAMGNAMTVRNNNSSRFGKLISIKFHANGAIVGASIVDYLLEKSRVASQAQGERNYHVFYELLAGCDHALKHRLQLTDASEYHCLNQSGATTIEGRSDENEFETMLRAMRTLEYSQAEREAVFDMIGAVLHLSNIKFDVESKATEEDGSRIHNADVLSLASSLLGLDSNALSKALTKRNVGSHSVILISYNIEQAAATRDATCKAIYGGVFRWTVGKINSSFDCHTGMDSATIASVLDIFGFESFENNSFEQLCINYCNEKLQGYFNDFVFRLEIDVYAAEAVEVLGSEFKDNQETLDLLEKRGVGIFAMLDEELSVPKGSDAGFLAKVVRAHDKHSSFFKPTAKNCSNKELQRVAFGIGHYAGKVIYNTTHFLEKNKDQLHHDVHRVLASSKKNRFMVDDVLPPVEVSSGRKNRTAARKGNTAAMATLGTQFKTQLKELMRTLNSTSPHFVRCMKPNKEKQGDVFDSAMMLEQMCYSGLLEVCRIRKMGYPVRHDFGSFVKRYTCLAPGTNDLDGLVDLLVMNDLLAKSQWAKGKTKIFMRTHQAFKLDLARDEALAAIVTVIQKIARRAIHRKRFRDMKLIVDRITKAIIMREEEPLAEALEEMCGELPYGGQHLSTVQEGKCLLVRLQEEKRVEALLRAAIEARDKSAILSAIAVATTMSFEPDDFAIANEVIARLEREANIKEKLKAAIASRDRQVLTGLLDQIQDVELDDIVRQARTLKARLDDEEKAILSLEEAIQARSISNLDAYVAKCVELGLFHIPQVKQAQKLHQQLTAEKTAFARVNAGAAIITTPKDLNAETEEATLDARLGEEIYLIAKLGEALDTHDMETLATHYRDAISRGLTTGSRVQEARILLERDQLVQKATAMLDECLASNEASSTNPVKSLEALNEALETAIQLGLVGDKVRRATDLRDSTAEMTEVLSEVTAACGTLRIRAESPSGITDDDLAPLETALARAESIGVGGAAVAGAKRLKDKMKKQLEIQVQLIDALEQKDRNALRRALDAALEHVEVSLSILDEVEAELKRSDAEFRSRKRPSDDDDDDAASPLDHEERNRISKQRRDRASNPKFAFQKYGALRSPDSYAKGFILNKKKVKDSMLKWQSTLIPRSLIELNGSKANDLALNIHRSLLGYAGDKAMTFTATLAHDILQKGQDPEIRDEIYVQIMKQLTSNPTSTSVALYWQVMCMCVSTFAPSIALEDHVVHFLLTALRTAKGSAVQNYARYSLHNLEDLLESGASRAVPSVDEIQAYAERPPVLADILLVDGTILVEDLAVIPSTDCDNICEHCAEILSLRDDRRFHFGIFVYDESGNDDDDDGQACSEIIRTPSPLQGTDYLGDVVVQKSRQNRNFRFVYKRKIFLPAHNLHSSTDVMIFQRLVYLQAEDEVINRGNLPIQEEQKAIQLAAISMAIALAGDCPDSTDALVAMSNPAMVDFLPLEWRDIIDVTSLAHKIHAYHQSLKPAAPNVIEALRRDFIEAIWNHELYGAHFFHCHKVEHNNQTEMLRNFPERVTIAFNAHGCFIFDASDTLLLKFPYEDLYRWGSSLTLISLDVCDRATESNFELRLSTPQAHDVAAIILDHINAIVAEKEASSNVYSV
ncbi:hypothetical protein CTAYLR_005941 [Chrysophaeum taylorii]|uniref:Uncharacterized protein n=1 Tax=Chrysophaeum taylorii TaxID=2483200 RepID=A0AAD7XKF9_9STRA|nr:hypothetical protein CTAYLR_005941 [Chrysophaeum taylorii]